MDTKLKMVILSRSRAPIRSHGEKKIPGKKLSLLPISLEHLKNEISSIDESLIHSSQQIEIYKSEHLALAREVEGLEVRIF